MDQKITFTATDPTLRQSAYEFLRSRTRRNCRPSTVETYRRTLERFMLWFGHERPITEVDKRVIRQYTDSMVDTMEPDSVDHHLRGIKVFLRWAASEDGDNILPAAPKIALPKLSTRLKRELVTPDDLARLLAAMNGQTVWDRRNVALTALLYDSGARIGEILGLEKRDLDLQAGAARVTGKGDKDRYIFFSAFTAELIDRYRRKLERVANPESLFVTNSLAPMTYVATVLVLRRAKERSGVRCAVNPHNFRHSFASNYLINGGDVMLLQRMLGHSSLAVTGRYAHFKTDDLRESHRDFMASQHPRRKAS